MISFILHSSPFVCLRELQEDMIRSDIENGKIFKFINEQPSSKAIKSSFYDNVLVLINESSDDFWVSYLIIRSGITAALEIGWAIIKSNINIQSKANILNFISKSYFSYPTKLIKLISNDPQFNTHLTPIMNFFQLCPSFARAAWKCDYFIKVLCDVIKTQNQIALQKDSIMQDINERVKKFAIKYKAITHCLVDDKCSVDDVYSIVCLMLKEVDICEIESSQRIFLIHSLLENSLIPDSKIKLSRGISSLPHFANHIALVLMVFKDTINQENMYNDKLGMQSLNVWIQSQ